MHYFIHFISLRACNNICLELISHYIQYKKCNHEPLLIGASMYRYVSYFCFIKNVSSPLTAQARNHIQCGNISAPLSENYIIQNMEFVLVKSQRKNSIVRWNTSSLASGKFPIVLVICYFIYIYTKENRNVRNLCSDGNRKPL